MEKEILQNWTKFLADTYPELTPKASIYLKVKPAVALERIKIRHREEERKISLEYLYELGELHDDVFGEKQKNVLMIDCNRTFKQMEQEYPRIADWIISQMQTQQKI
jgi:thymidylate kinase